MRESRLIQRHFKRLFAFQTATMMRLIVQSFMSDQAEAEFTTRLAILRWDWPVMNSLPHQPSGVCMSLFDYDSLRSTNSFGITYPAEEPTWTYHSATLWLFLANSFLCHTSVYFIRRIIVNKINYRMSWRAWKRHWSTKSLPWKTKSRKCVPWKANIQRPTFLTILRFDAVQLLYNYKGPFFT